MTTIYNINGDSINFDQESTEVSVTCNLDMLINLFKNSNQMIFLTNKDGEIIYANDKFLELYGFEEEEILNCTPLIFAVPGNSEIIYEEVNRSKLTEKWNGKLLSRKNDGSVFIIELHAERLLNEEGNVYATLWITNDMTISQNIKTAMKRLIPEKKPYVNF